jgi:DHA1 family tetracycline resistance protein-like MFS transporter
MTFRQRHTMEVGVSRFGNKAFSMVLTTVVLDVLALALVAPVLPQLVLRFLEGRTSEAALIYGLFGTSWALMQFVFSPVQGALSDRFGRRPVIILSNIGTGLDYILMAAAPTLGVLMFGRVINGITSASISTAGAYIADTLPPDRRSAGFGMIGTAFGVGFVIGPALGGILGSVDPRLPFWVAAGLSLTNAFYGWIVLPESLPSERRRAFAWSRANPLGALSLLSASWRMTGLATVSFASFLAQQALPAVFVLYADHRFGWGAGTVGWTLAAFGACAAVVGWRVGSVVRRLGERRTALAGLLGSACGFGILGLAPAGWIFWLGIPVLSLWGLETAAIQSLMTAQVGANDQGRLQGARSSLIGLATLIGPSLFTSLFAVAVDSHTSVFWLGAPFLAAATLRFAAFAAALWVTRESNLV